MRSVAVFMKPMLKSLVVVGVGSLALLGCSGRGTVSTSSTVVASSAPTSSAPQQVVAPTTTVTVPESTTAPNAPPECTEALPQLPGPAESLIFAVCDFDTSLPYPLVRGPLPGLDPVGSALTLLVRGTTATERERGLMVGFDWVEPADAQRITVQADIDDAGTIHLGFTLDGAPWHPGTLAGTSFQAFSFADPLYATVFQFPEVTGIGPGSLCWGELDCTQVFTRAMWETMVSINARRDIGPGCGMLGAWFDPACGATLPGCGEDLEIIPAGEGATGSAVYYLEVTAPDSCFVELDGSVTVLSADGTVADVDGSPLVFQMAGVVRDGFRALDQSMSMWVLQNWCETGGTVRIDVNGTHFDEPAGGRCDDPDAPALLRAPLAATG